MIGGIATVALHDDMAMVAQIFETVTVAMTPPFALIVVNTTGVLAQVSAQCCRRPVSRAGNQQRRFGQSRKARQYRCVRGQCRQRNAATDAQTSIRLLGDRRKLGDPGQVDERGRLPETPA